MCSVQQLCFLVFAASAAAGASLVGQCDSELSDSAALLQTNIAGRPEAVDNDHGPAEEDSALASKMQWDDQHCACTTVFLAAVLDTGTNVVHHKDHSMGGFSFFQRYYESIIALPGGRAKAVIIHNRLPENLTRAKSNSVVSFTKVDISGMHEHMTVVEWRWIVLFDQVCEFIWLLNMRPKRSCRTWVGESRNSRTSRFCKPPKIVPTMLNNNLRQNTPSRSKTAQHDDDIDLRHQCLAYGIAPCPKIAVGKQNWNT